MLCLDKGSRPLSRSKIHEEFSRPRCVTVASGPDQAGDDHAIQDDVLAARGELVEAVGHNRTSGSLARLQPHRSRSVPALLVRDLLNSRLNRRDSVLQVRDLADRVVDRRRQRSSLPKDDLPLSAAETIKKSEQFGLGWQCHETY